jgi:exopolysaccharide biosynthesis polyprenyl glycosylphosphotransferase
MTSVDSGPHDVEQAVGEAITFERYDDALLQVAPDLALAPERAVPKHGAMVVRRHTGRLLLILDVLGVALSFGVGAVALAAGLGRGTDAGHHVGWWVALYLPLFLVSFSLYGLYRRERRRLFATTFPDLLYMAHALLAAGAGVVGVSRVLRDVVGIRPALTVTGAAAITVPALLTVPLCRVVGGAVARRRGLVRSRVIILGSGVVADSVIRRLARFDDIEVLGCVDDVGNYTDGVRGVSGIDLLGEVARLPGICEELDADRVVVAFSPAAAPDIADTLRQLPPHVRVSVVPRLFDLLTWRSHVDELHGLPVMDVAPPVLGRGHRALKRALDLALSLGLALLLLPFWLVIPILIKLTSPGPVLFRQERCGRNGRSFWIYKFRTMRLGADLEKSGLKGNNEVDGPIFKMKNDPRVTRVGRVLRAASLDELPQLFNVIKGDMSVVGPRPFVVDEAGQIEGWAARRFDVRPGMTGLWQVSGRNDLPFEELRRLDYAYVASWSLWWDLKIIWQTPACVFRRRGAY